MLTVEQIRAVGVPADERERTDRLKQELAGTSCLTMLVLDEILQWKLRGQYGRTRARRGGLTESMVRAVTTLAFGPELAHADPDTEAALRLGVLCALPGVGLGVASAVLALRFPDRYAVIDPLVWGEVCGTPKTTFSITDYAPYMQALRPLAQALGWPVQEVDLALWTYAYELSKRLRYLPSGRGGSEGRPL